MFIIASYFVITGGVQNLGFLGSSDIEDGDFDIEDDQFYSEMWFGDYPNYPARVLSTGQLLGDVLQKEKEELLGKKVAENFDAQLPFLPKVRR